jgi:hypothetical protein
VHTAGAVPMVARAEAGRAMTSVGPRGVFTGETGGPPRRAAVTDAPLAVAGGKASGTGRATAAVGARGVVTGGISGPTGRSHRRTLSR